MGWGSEQWLHDQSLGNFVWEKGEPLRRLVDIYISVCLLTDHQTADLCSAGYFRFPS